jgi:serine/threonine protein phosphatase PrpC
MIGFALTDKGIVRRQNQDVGYVNGTIAPDTVLAVVCDGMGGARSGQVASQLAVDTFVEKVTQLLQRYPAADAADLLAAAEEEANKAVFSKSQMDARYYGMGTTLVAALLRGVECCVLNVGDSRAYHVTPRRIRRITRDHSVVAELVARGDITEEESLHHPHRNLITRALGTEESVRADTFYVTVAEGEYILLCSDGLSNMLSDDELFAELKKDGSIEAHCDNLVKSALLRGAPDNITVVLCRI